MLAGAVLVVCVLVYRQVDQLTTTRVDVWVSAVPIKSGQTVVRGHLKQVAMPPPTGALVEPGAILGRRLLADKAVGEPFYLKQLEQPAPPPPLASTVPAGRLLASVRIDAMDLPVPALRIGDRLDIMQARPDGVLIVARDAYMMGTLADETPPPQDDGGSIFSDLTKGLGMGGQGGPATAQAPALILALYPQDIFPLVAAEASGTKMKIILHSATEVASGKLLDVRPPSNSRAGGTARRDSIDILAGSGTSTVFLGAARPATSSPPDGEAGSPGSTARAPR